jgi:hypothetical protein
VKFAYADPPYLGQARRHYGPNAHEVNHQILIATLSREFPDGWALSCSSPSLQTLPPLCPPDVRVLAWVKPFCSFKPGVGVAYAWEPVIVRGGRRRIRAQHTIRDWLAASSTLRTGVAGAKPEAFCRWLFSVFNAQPGDELVDLFPGTGIVTRTWQVVQAELAIHSQPPDPEVGRRRGGTDG